jgi:hypothetical protein
MKYVIFFPRGNDQEYYVARGLEGGHRMVKELDGDTLRFATAREAYDFAGDHELYNARVGVR